MPRLVALVAVLLLLLAPGAALGQSTPFGPVPTPEPTVSPAAGDDGVSRSTLYLIAGGVLVLVVGIGIAITRDARRSLTPEDRAALEREERGERGARADGDRPPGTVSKEARARAKKQRGKVKAARRARRRNR